MDFRGHSLIILEPEVKTKDALDKRIKYTSWVLDKTDFCIYSVKLNRAKIAICKKLVGKMRLDRKTGVISFVKLSPVPIQILRKAEIEARKLHKLIES